MTESRREWMLWMFERAGKKNSNVKNRQFWQQHNKPIELWSNKVIDQKLDYVYNNPVESGFVTEPHHWKYSSAKNYADEIGAIEIDFLKYPNSNDKNSRVRAASSHQLGDHFCLQKNLHEIQPCLQNQHLILN